MNTGPREQTPLDLQQLGEEVPDTKSNQNSLDEDWDLLAVMCGAMADSDDTGEQAPFVEEAQRVLAVMAAAGYAVVKLPECQMEQRDHGEKRPIFRIPDTDPGYLMVQVQRTDDGYGVGSISGNYTPAEAITRGTVWLAAGVEALRLQGGDPR